ncbi:4085_t:CDS:2 [Funneliformis mosseae]|uniref:4085_t:CDS:1 n=1 Tax=Funneliformis mosseae TaxID=27381 RepID=A0A9N8VZI6_FUNMO|nr:4085_t:CDS:2 [Funneliformis mosseae]
MPKRKKSRTHVKVDERTDNPDGSKIPKSFVFKSGDVGKTVEALVRDMRRVMEPHTAIRLKERKSNRLKDFVAVAGQLGVTQFLIFTRTENGTNFRLTKTPRGPTLCFRALKYSLIRDVLSSQISPISFGTEFLTSPLLVLNNFGGEEKQMKLMTTMFQSMFPSINVNKVQLAEARRVVLFNYNSDTNTIDFRHYIIRVKPIGISKSVRRIINSNVPDLHEYHDISEFVLSEAESGFETTVTLAQDFVGKINKKADQRAIKLVEVGPRMELQLVKIQSGFCDGEVLFHEFWKKMEVEDEEDSDDIDSSEEEQQQQSSADEMDSNDLEPRMHDGNFQEEESENEKNISVKKIKSIKHNSNNNRRKNKIKNASKGKPKFSMKVEV